MYKVIKFTNIRDIWSIWYIYFNPFTYVYMAGEGLWNSPPGVPLQMPNCGNLCPPCKLMYSRNLSKFFAFKKLKISGPKCKLLASWPSARKSTIYYAYLAELRQFLVNFWPAGWPVDHTYCRNCRQWLLLHLQLQDI